ncbi:MAG: amidohydrolase family protein [Gemmataceae bacterium]
MRTLVIGVALLLASPALADEPPLAIRNAVVETLAAAGRIEGATVLVRDGKIAAVGTDVAVPDNATVIDAAGGTVMPGVIDPYFEVTIAAGAADAAAPRTIVGRGGRPGGMGGFGNRGGGAAFTRVADNFYPFDPGYKPLPRVGLTRLNLVTTGAGQAAVVRVTPADPEHMLELADGTAYATVTNSTDSLDQVRTKLDSAARSLRLGTRPAPGSPQAAGTQLWNEVHDGKTALVAQCGSPAAVLHLLKAIEPYRSVQLVLFLTGDAIYETASALKDHKARVILRPGLDLVPNTRDRFNPARLLHEAGVEFAFSLTARPPAQPAAGRLGAAPTPTDEAETTPPLTIDVDFPLFPVAMLVKTGLPRRQALEALAKKPATLLGLDKTHGTIEPGKSADLLLFTGDPLDPASRLRRTLIDGRTAYAN